jgi:hypothetical protein
MRKLIRAVAKAASSTKRKGTFDLKWSSIVEGYLECLSRSESHALIKDITYTGQESSRRGIIYNVGHTIGVEFKLIGVGRDS